MPPQEGRDGEGAAVHVHLPEITCKVGCGIAPFPRASSYTDRCHQMPAAFSGDLTTGSPHLDAVGMKGGVQPGMYAEQGLTDDPLGPDHQ